MAFNTPAFFLFWFALYLLFSSVARANSWKVGILLVGNLIFFTLLTHYAVILLLAASALDFAIAKNIPLQSKDSSKKSLMWVSVLLNIGLILGFRHLSDWFQLNNMESDIHFPIPLYFIGVSFYAFRSMSYVFDVYYETIQKPETNIFHYWTYASFFPIILSGPLANATEFLQKLRSKTWYTDTTALNAGAFLIASGIIKKFIIGNYLSVNFVDRVFESAEFFTSMEVFIAALLQTFALYFDFSGYTDIAIGLSLWLGFQIPQNFNFPFFAQNVTEYWKRWHITLSQWFNSYVYFPLSYALRRWKRAGTSLAVLVVFGLSGFWHGTAPNYWIWGLMHAVCMIWDVYSNQWRNSWRNNIPALLYKPLSIILTFGFLVFSGIYFKSRSIEAANSMVQKMSVGLDWTLFPDWYDLYSGVFWMSIIAIVGHFSLAYFYPRIQAWFTASSYLISAVFLVITILLAYQFNRLDSLPFYYLQF